MSAEVAQGAELSLVRRVPGMPGEPVLSGEDVLPVIPALRTLLPGGGLRRGSVVAAGPWSLLCPALAPGA
jgi:hypothetical protein